MSFPFLLGCPDLLLKNEYVCTLQLVDLVALCSLQLSPESHIDSDSQTVSDCLGTDLSSMSCYLFPQVYKL